MTVGADDLPVRAIHPAAPQRLRTPCHSEEPATKNLRRVGATNLEGWLPPRPRMPASFRTEQALRRNDGGEPESKRVSKDDSWHQVRPPISKIPPGGVLTVPFHPKGSPFVTRFCASFNRLSKIRDGSCTGPALSPRHPHSFGMPSLKPYPAPQPGAEQVHPNYQQQVPQDNEKYLAVVEEAQR